jgi:hypothetical protein
MALVAVPPVGTMRSLVALNCASAAMSSAFLASFFRTLSITSITGCLDRSSSLLVNGTLLPYSVTVMVPWVIVKLVTGRAVPSVSVVPCVATSEYTFQ